MVDRTYFTFDLVIDRASSGGYTVNVISSPAGEARGEFNVPFSPGELERMRSADRGRIRDEGKVFGGRLFDALFTGEIRSIFYKSLDQAQSRGADLRIRLRLQAPELAELPWELLFDNNSNRFLSLSSEVVLSRYSELATRGQTQPVVFDLPLRILVIVSGVGATGKSFDVEKEQAALTDALAAEISAGSISLGFLTRVTLSDLRKSLRAQEYHIVHYIGHCVSDSDSDSGSVLVFEDESGNARLVSADIFSRLLHDSRIRLLVIEYAEIDAQKFTYLPDAMTFVRNGIPGVITLPSTSQSARFARELYISLAEGLPLDAAIAEGRKSLYAKDLNGGWDKPVLTMSAPDGVVLRPADTPASGSGNISIGASGATVIGDVIDQTIRGDRALQSQATAAVAPLMSSKTINDIRAVWQVLPKRDVFDPVSLQVSKFRRASEDVNKAMQQNSSYNQRLALSGVENLLVDLLQSLNSTRAAYAPYFIPAAQQWIQIVSDYTGTLFQQVEASQEIDNPYIIGVPLTEAQEIFVGREHITSRIEKLLLDKKRPPLLLYGQRRMGKTSLLNNLGRLLPSTVIPCFVDLQGPPAQASNHAGLLFNVARQMVHSAQRQRGLTLTSLEERELKDDPFTAFDLWLDRIERDVGSNRSILLELDEFEKLDEAFTDGRFNEAQVLGTFRHIIQHRGQFKLLISGSHSLEEYKHWASYLINVQVVHLGYLKEDEARKLVEKPLSDFPLRYDPDASERVLDVTRGHPFLVQLLCAEIITLKNEQPIAQRRRATLADVEEAIPEALNSGRLFFDDIEVNQVDESGLAVMKRLAEEEEGGACTKSTLARVVRGQDIDLVIRRLLNRELIELVGSQKESPQSNGWARLRLSEIMRNFRQLSGGEYRIQLEMIRRWFAEMV